jgi:hypothetical protein
MYKRQGISILAITIPHFRTSELQSIILFLPTIFISPKDLIFTVHLTPYLFLYLLGD